MTIYSIPYSILASTTREDHLRNVRDKTPPPADVAPWFVRRDYLEHRALDWTLPASFDEWEAAAEANAGPPRNRKRVVIQAGEFSQWCVSEGRPHNGAARIAFALKAARRVFPGR